MSINLELVNAPTEDARMLIAELDAELDAEYPPEQRHGLSVDRAFQSHVVFFVARLAGQPVALGALSFEHGLAEVKRMYVRPQARGHGVAQAVLARLELEARSRGVTRLTLETGDIRHAAMRLYERAGFTRCEAFGAYTTMPPHAIERSVFFEKRISDAEKSRPQSE